MLQFYGMSRAVGWKKYTDAAEKGNASNFRLEEARNLKIKAVLSSEISANLKSNHWVISQNTEVFSEIR